MGRQVTEKEEDYDRSTVRELIEQTPLKVEKAFVALVFLSGGRLSECLSLKKHHFSQATKGERQYLILKIRTLKKKKYRTRRVPVPLGDDLTRYVVDYLNDLKPTDLLFPFSRTSAWRLIKRLSRKIDLDLWVHLLRHLRLTELVAVKDFTDQQLVRMTGWEDSRPAKTYTSLKWQDIADKM